MTKPQDLVCVYRAANSTEAYFVKNLLAEENIAAYVTEDADPLPGLQIDPPEVFVTSEHEARARVVVEAYDRQTVERAERPSWSCPKCHRTVEGSFDECDVCGAFRPGVE
jgi:hypothetical protein